MTCSPETTTGRLVVEFIRGLYARDPRDDQGRYATTKGGDLSLAAAARPPSCSASASTASSTHSTESAGEDRAPEAPAYPYRTAVRRSVHACGG